MWWVSLALAGAPEEVVEELCRWGMISEIVPVFAPAELDLDALVREEDLRFVRQERAERYADERYRAATFSMVPGVRALNRALSVRTECMVERVKKDGKRLELIVTSSGPTPEGELERPLQDIALIDADADRIAAAEALVPSLPVRTGEDPVTLLKTGKQWQLYLGLPEAEQDRLLQRIRGMDAVLDRDMVAIVDRVEANGVYEPTKVDWGVAHTVTVTVSNGTERAIRQVDLSVVVDGTKGPAEHLGWTTVQPIEPGASGVVAVTLSGPADAIASPRTQVQVRGIAWGDNVFELDDVAVRPVSQQADLVRGALKHLADQKAALEGDLRALRAAYPALN